MGTSGCVLELAILGVIYELNSDQSRTLTFGQIYMALLRAHSNISPISECVVVVNLLVTEGLIVSRKVLDHDRAFPYTQHLIGGLTEVGVAALKSCVP
ncbi:hypothetical protein CYL20_04240 [Pseudomonas palleroniana]|uniref:Uncharacterized protein n=1 Tax=Pseudomonas palleroniana TaxID=191390 RepID=A0A2L1J5P6_9PSED|nr:hypothetical protein [Pseudomonas palleroniana]AVE03793.1 hypothetical protein CYL20_04240 [Pseudomonas palleroniana]